jgi:hypothetical protein
LQLTDLSQPAEILATSDTPEQIWAIEKNITNRKNGTARVFLTLSQILLRARGH